MGLGAEGELPAGLNWGFVGIWRAVGYMLWAAASAERL